jgi:hypothetical protein
MNIGTPARIRAVVSTLTALLGMSSGCDGSEPAGPPMLSLDSPADGDTVCGTPLRVATTIENFTLTNEDIEDAPGNVGHMHVYLNGQEVAQSDQEVVEVNDVEDGAWQLRVDLALANHNALDPYVGETIYITVDNGLCEPAR